jgi:pimeloyl-ACP methyl ester carboxylesterase
MSTSTRRTNAVAEATTPANRRRNPASTPEASQASHGAGTRSSSSSRRGHIGLVVLGSIALGSVTALLLAVLVFGGSEEPTVTGVVLLGFAVGWAVLVVGSVRGTDSPQWWAVVPAGFMGVSGVALFAFQPGTSTVGALCWVWPPALLGLTLWMVVQSRRTLHNWSRRAVLYPVFAVLVAMAAGALYEDVGEAGDQASLAMAGRLVDVGDHRLHIQCTGSGSPTVVLEGGLGEPSAALAGWIAPAVAATTKVCVYDRAGYAESDPAPSPQDGRRVARDLHALLGAAGVAPPYVLAGHSTGGVYTRIFAGRYPTEVAGLVMLDAQPADVYTRLPGWRTFYSWYRRGEALAPSLARLGTARIAYAIVSSSLPSTQRTEQRAVMSAPAYYGALHDEIAQLRTSLTQAEQVTGFGDTPLIVVTAGKDAQDGWLPLQDSMARLSTNSVHRILPDATHASLIEDHHDSAASVAAILDVVRAVRSGRPLEP